MHGFSRLFTRKVCAHSRCLESVQLRDNGLSSGCRLGRAVVSDGRRWIKTSPKRQLELELLGVYSTLHPSHTPTHNRTSSRTKLCFANESNRHTPAVSRNHIPRQHARGMYRPPQAAFSQSLFSFRYVNVEREGVAFSPRAVIRSHD